MKTLPIMLLVSLAAAALGEETGALPEVRVDLAKDGGTREARLAVGQALAVYLPGNPTTGYSWVLVEGTGTVVEAVGDADYRPDDTRLMGSGGVFVFGFRAAGKGSAALRFEYRRPWEKDKPALHQAAVDVSVE